MHSQRERLFNLRTLKVLSIYVSLLSSSSKFSDAMKWQMWRKLFFHNVNMLWVFQPKLIDAYGAISLFDRELAYGPSLDRISLASGLILSFFFIKLIQIVSNDCDCISDMTHCQTSWSFLFITAILKFFYCIKLKKSNFHTTSTLWFFSNVTKDGNSTWRRKKISQICKKILIVL